MVTRDDRRAVALATRRGRSARYAVRRRVGLDFLPGPEPLEVDEPALPPPRPRRRQRRSKQLPSNGPRPAAPEPRDGWRWAARLLVVALVAAMAAAGIFGRQWYDQRQLDSARQQALAAARQVTVNFVSISAATVDRDLQRIADGATGEFKDEFTRGTSQVRAAVVANKVDSRGTVLRAGIVSADRHSAVVLVAVDATVQNTNAPEGRLSHYRIQVSLVRDAGSGRWLVSQLQFVG